MLFHVGALWRLYESGLLKEVKRISSVSGGSITAGLLGLKWSRLPEDPTVGRPDFVREVVDPIRGLADQTVDVSAVFKGIFLPGNVADRVAEAYAEHLYGKRDAAGPAGRTTLRHQCHERPNRSAVALLQARTWPTIEWAWSRTRRSDLPWQSRRRQHFRPCSLPCFSSSTRPPSKPRQGADLHKDHTRKKRC